MGCPKITFSLSSEAVTRLDADGVIIPVFKKAGDASKAKGKTKTDATASIVWPIKLDKALQDEILAIADEEKFDGAAGKLLTVRRSTANKLKARRLVVLGLGEVNKLQAKHWEQHLVKAINALFALKEVHHLGILLSKDAPNVSAEASVALAVDAVHQATYRSMEAKEPVKDAKKITLLTESKADARLKAALERGEALARARSMVKDLVNHPSNLKNTNTLVNRAKEIGKNADITVKVQSDAKWLEKNMPCFFTVAKGSLVSDPPKFISLHYKPKSGKAKKHIAIVGKSVIFDTGGYQVKPGDYMVTMKGDMTGGAVALAVIQALSELKPQGIEVSAYLAATPNKIDSDAMIPDSIVDTACGKKVEIRHTDAEGRLTLIDAVAKAAEQKPDEMITIATLTGAASQAVGYYIALMGNDEALRGRIHEAGKMHAEPIQTLDVNDDDYENIKSKLDGADLINTSQRKHRGAQSAAAFVMSGAPDGMPMAHLDIAGADMTPDEKATGVSVKTVLQYLLNEAEGAAKSKSSPAKISKQATKKTATKKAATSSAKAKKPKKTTDSKKTKTKARR